MYKNKWHCSTKAAVQMNPVGTAHQLKMYSEACFCLLSVEDLDGQEIKCVFISVWWTLWYCCVCLRGEVQIQEEYSTWDGSEMIHLTSYKEKKNDPNRLTIMTLIIY